MFFKIFKEVYAEAKKREYEEKRKEKLLDKEMDYAFLEELIQKINENPLLRIKVTLHDGTQIDLNCTPKKKNTIDVFTPYEDEMEVR